MNIRSKTDPIQSEKTYCIGLFSITLPAKTECITYHKLTTADFELAWEVSQDLSVFSEWFLSECKGVAGEFFRDC